MMAYMTQIFNEIIVQLYLYIYLVLCVVYMEKKKKILRTIDSNAIQKSNSMQNRQRKMKLPNALR